MGDELQTAIDRMNQRRKERNKARKTLKKGDWCTYGGMMGIWGIGQIESVNHKSNTCVIKKYEGQTDFHGCYWELSPYVDKCSSFKEAAESWYNVLRQGDHWGGGMHRRDFEFLMAREWPSYCDELKRDSTQTTDN